jgi:hypothetical protein
MTAYLYGLLLDRNAHLVPAHITGLSGATLRVVPCGDVSALASTVAAKPRTASIDDVRAHDHALQAAVHHGATIASVRFGQTFADDADLRRYVASIEGRVHGLLQQRDGCVEMRLVLALGPGPWDDHRKPNAQSPEPIGPGTAYMEGLRGHPAVRGLALRTVLGPIVLGEHVEALAGGRGASFSHLIRREDEAAYRETVGREPSLRGASVIGPLPFYSFAEASDE